MSVESSAKISQTPRLLISALAGGGGKTLLALGLTHTFAKMGLAVKAFKKGPDYIDAAWLAAAANFPATNLDLFFLSSTQIKRLFARALNFRREEDSKLLALVEGNRGLFDGLDQYGSCSSAELARLLDLPILLTLDCTKMTRTTAALVQGIQNFEKGLNFVGLILNRVGTKRQAGLLRQVLEYYTDLPILGILPRTNENLLPERHMGLASFGRSLSLDLEVRLSKISHYVQQYADVETLLEKLVAYAKKDRREDVATTDSLNLPLESKPNCQESPCSDLSFATQVTIAVAYDQALWFYYLENWQALEAEGAKLIFFSLLEDFPLEEVDGLYLGGGFPEDFAKPLSLASNITKLKSLAEQGLPIYAECGGLMVLAKSLEVAKTSYPLAKVLDLDVQFCAKPQGLGYIEGEIVASNPYFPIGYHIKGHEFHYSTCKLGTKPNLVFKLSRGQGLGQCGSHNYDGLVSQNVWASYTHIFGPATPLWAKNFVQLAKNYHTSPKRLMTRSSNARLGT